MHRPELHLRIFVYAMRLCRVSNCAGASSGHVPSTDTFLSMGSQALRIISWGFPIASFCVVLSAVFQALGIGLYATIVSLARQLLVLLPVAYLLSLSNRLELVWWSFPVAELVCIIVTLFFFYRVYRKKLRPISEASVSGTPGRP